MKFSCNKRVLSEAVNNLLPAVAGKATIPALEGILLDVLENRLRLSSYNLELGIVTELAVTGTEPGIMVIQASLLANILVKMPDGEVTFRCDDKLLTEITCGDVTFTVLGMPATDYPALPQFDGEEILSLPGETLQSMIEKTIFAVSQSDQNPILTGSLFDLKDGVLKLVSVDGVRLALRQEKIRSEENLSFVVPGKSLSEVGRLLSRLGDEEENVTVQLSGKHILFKLTDYAVISRLLEGSFLDYQKAIPKERETAVSIKTRLFLDSINRASIIINDRAKSPIRCEFAGETLRLYCETPLGKVNDLLPIKTEGAPVQIGFNHRYMADALKAVDCETVELSMNGAISPIVLTDPADDSFLFLVLPVRLK